MTDTKHAAQRKAIRLAVITDDHGFVVVVPHTPYSTCVNGSPRVFDVHRRVQYVFRARTQDASAFETILHAAEEKRRKANDARSKAWVTSRKNAWKKDVELFFQRLEASR